MWKLPISRLKNYWLLGPIAFLKNEETTHGPNWYKSKLWQFEWSLWLSCQLYWHSFFGGFDRIAEIAAKFKIQLSIFIVGKDLEDQVVPQVKEWSDQGHEIGNHSWSHPVNLGALPKTEIYDEVIRSHDIIFEATGKELEASLRQRGQAHKTFRNINWSKLFLWLVGFHPCLYPLAIRMAINRWKICSRPIRRFNVEIG